MPLKWLDDLDNMVLAVLVYVSLLLSGVVLTDEGLAHVLSPAGSKLAGWLGMLGLSVDGNVVLVLFVMAVGVLVFLSGLGLVFMAGRQLVDAIA